MFKQANGVRYVRFLLDILEKNVFDWYLEVGCRSGRIFGNSRGKTIAVDPYFQVQSNVINVKPELHVFQKTSDDFFASNFLDAIDAKLSKQNLIYYFASKEILYRAVIENVIDVWMDYMALIEEQNLAPRDAMKRYLWKKIELSRDYPAASKVFAHEIINGAPMLKDYLLSKVKPQFEHDVAIIKNWIKEGLVKPVSAEHLLFTIWASTQTNADFATQIQLLLDKPELDEEYFQASFEFLYQSLIEPFFD